MLIKFHIICYTYFYIVFLLSNFYWFRSVISMNSSDVTNICYVSSLFQLIWNLVVVVWILTNYFYNFVAFNCNSIWPVCFTHFSLWSLQQCQFVIAAIQVWINFQNNVKALKRGVRNVGRKQLFNTVHHTQGRMLETLNSVCHHQKIASNQKVPRYSFSAWFK